MTITFDQLQRLLPHVERPGRYVGGEVNAVRKPWDTTPTRICLAFPDLYDLGMSNLGMMVLYDILNRLDGVLAERTYAPWPDMAAALRRSGLPLYSLESFHPLAEFDIVGFSLPYETLYTNLLEMLDLANLPLLSSERHSGHPLIIAGGHATFNPEPMADFVDAFVIGEGEEVVVEMARTFERVRSLTREAQLHALAQVPGVYVPRFYDVTYHADGRVAEVTPNRPGLPFPIRRRIVAQLPPPPTRLLVPNITITHDRGTVEIQRGCLRGCRFCHAGFVTRPLRERPMEEILAAVDDILEATGYEEIALLSLSSADHSQIGPLVERLMQRYGERRLSISLPSLRLESFSVNLADAISRGRRTGFTFAPEAGTERLRAVINKAIPAGQLLQVVGEVFRRGWRTVKLYFMIGLPGEEPEDVRAITDLVQAVRAEGRRVHGRQAQVNVTLSTFVPKPHTPFQWAALVSPDEMRSRQRLLRESLRGSGVKLSWSDPRVTPLEAALSRGDRRLGAVIAQAWRLGAHFDSWDEHFNEEAWAAAFSSAPPPPVLPFYAYRERTREERFPWDHIATGVHKSYLWQQWEMSLRGKAQPDCRTHCTGCGILAEFGVERNEEWVCPMPSKEQG